ncbi:MAG: hypothetical protein JO217_12600 [Acidobacteriaceae bacterium]|nr:hypothetical protein [Acidobacteriaceae bacterium]
MPGEKKPRRESSASTDKKIAVRLLNQRKREVDERPAASSTATPQDLLVLYLAGDRRHGRHSYKPAKDLCACT